MSLNVCSARNASKAAFPLVIRTSWAVEDTGWIVPSTIFAQVAGASGERHPVTLALLGHALGRADRVEEARATLLRLEELRDAGTYVPPEYPALIHIALGDLDRAVAGLEAAFEARSSAIAFMGVDPLTRPLRAHPEFLRLLEKAGLPGGSR